MQTAQQTMQVSLVGKAGTLADLWGDDDGNDILLEAGDLS